MVSIGRNDPCWCGSGKKYKKCHLAADEQRERELRSDATAHGTYEAGPAAPYPTDEPEDWLEDDPFLDDTGVLPENEKIWERFEAANPDEMEAIYLEAIESGKMDAELAFEMPLEMRYEVDGERFKALVDRLRIGLPEEYAAIARDLSLWMIESAAAQGKNDRIPALLRPFVDDPGRATHVLFDVIDVLMFYGQTEPLLDLMKATAKAVLESEDLVPEAKQSFVNAAVALVTARYLDASGEVDTTNPEFRDAISTFLPDIADRIGDLEGTQHGIHSLTIGDLRPDNRKGTRERIWQMLREIGIRWANSLLRERPSLYPRAQLARQEILGFQSELLDRDEDGERLLLPQPKDLDRYLGVMLGPIEPMPHRVAAMMELLPGYLQFLVQQGLLSDEQVREETASLRAITESTVKVLGKLTPELAPFVERAWN